MVSLQEESHDKTDEGTFVKSFLKVYSKQWLTHYMHKNDNDFTVLY